MLTRSTARYRRAIDPSTITGDCCMMARERLHDQSEPPVGSLARREADQFREETPANVRPRSRSMADDEMQKPNLRKARGRPREHFRDGPRTPRPRRRSIFFFVPPYFAIARSMARGPCRRASLPFWRWSVVEKAASLARRAGDGPPPIDMLSEVMLQQTTVLRSGPISRTSRPLARRRRSRRGREAESCPPGGASAIMRGPLNLLACARRLPRITESFPTTRPHCAPCPESAATPRRDAAIASAGVRGGVFQRLACRPRACSRERGAAVSRERSRARRFDHADDEGAGDFAQR